MLSELYIQNFAIIDDLRLTFDAGLNVLTGETGAGKSIILDAMALVLGDRADTTMVRDGSDTAYVESTFHLDAKMLVVMDPLLKSEGLEGDSDEILLLSRELRLSGRNICRINGRAVSLSIQKQMGELLVDIHGQGEHLSLLKPRSHLPLLDAYAGLNTDREIVARTVRQLRSVQREKQKIQHDELTLARRADLLSHQVSEIDGATLHDGEEEELREERQRLANIEHLLQYTNSILLALNGLDDELPSTGDLLGQAEHATEQLASLDPSMKSHLVKLQEISFQLSDFVSDLIGYQSRLEYDPARLDFVEERLELITRLKRKYGNSIVSILAARDAAENELATISHSEESLLQLKKQEEDLLHQVGKLGEKLSNRRQNAGKQLASAIEIELIDLNMERARFDIQIEHIDADGGAWVGSRRLAFDENGIDQIELLVSANAGESLKPLAKVASGGETSRLMLALKTVLARVDETPTLIFDEIDQGIGGRIGDIVGRKLWALTNPAEHQVIVVTHLPQLAGYADGHFHVSKQLSGERTTTMVAKLDKDGRVHELAEMLGTDDQHARGAAESILRQAAINKSPTTIS
ncbi:MAG TPA: DNA repair protein RecN [Patescibacteria group bacterium]|nr:DNA repair protein RecN [Patescibacteria group bacterium]